MPNFLVSIFNEFKFPVILVNLSFKASNDLENVSEIMIEFARSLDVSFSSFISSEIKAKKFI